MSARWIVLAALCWVGCSGGRQGTAARAAAPPTAAPAPPPPAAVAQPTPAPRSAAARPWSPWRIVGHPSSSEHIQVGPALPGLGQWLMTSPYAPALALDVPSGARVQLGPDTLLWAFERAPNALVLVHGRLTVQRLPDAPRVGESALRVVTALVTVSVPAPAEFVIGAFPSGGGAAVGVVMLRGSIELLRYGVAPELVLAEQQRWPATPGLTVRGAKSASEAQRTIDGALTASASPALEDADGNLSVALELLTELKSEGDRLLGAVSRQHAGAVPNAERAAPPRTEDEVRTYQRSVTDHARRVHAAREALQLTAERSLLDHALHCVLPLPGTASACPSLQAWRERFDAALDASR